MSLKVSIMSPADALLCRRDNEGEGLFFWPLMHFVSDFPIAPQSLAPLTLSHLVSRKK